MSDARLNAAADFLQSTEFAGATLAPLTADASNRRYFRVTTGERRAVVMDSPPTKGEDVRPFIAIGTHLRAEGFAAPEVYAADEEQGFLLLEDLGDGLFARVLNKDPSAEPELYSAAVNLLAALADAPLPKVDAYDPSTMGPLAGLAAEWYAGQPEKAEAISHAVRDTLAALPHEPPVLALRDFHAENLIWLPERKGHMRVGLLDFQDARTGHYAYDLASLLRDARRDVDPDLRAALARSYADARGVSHAAVDHALAAQGAQRNLRILGVFARLTLRDAKPGYLKFMPRVWANLMAELDHPALADLRRTTLKILPHPTAEHLAELERRCGTIPKPA